MCLFGCLDLCAIIWFTCQRSYFPNVLQKNKKKNNKKNNTLHESLHFPALLWRFAASARTANTAPDSGKPRSLEHRCKCKFSVLQIPKNDPFVINTGQNKNLPTFGDPWAFSTVSLNGLQWFQKYLEEAAVIFALYHLGKRRNLKIRSADFNFFLSSSDLSVLLFFIYLFLLCLQPI